MSEALFASSLASHLAVAIAFVLLFGVATALPPRPISLRWSAAAVPIVGLRLTLVALLLVNSWVIFDTDLLVFWLQWFAAAATGVATGWVLLLPQPHPRWDSGLLAVTTGLVVGLSVSVGIDQLAGASWPIGLWSGFGLLVGLSLIVLFSIKRISNWPMYALAYTALAFGFGLDGFFGTGLLRTGEALVYPVVALLISRKLVRGGVEQVSLGAGGTERTSAALARALPVFDRAMDKQLLAHSGLRLISHFLGARYGVLLVGPDPDGGLSVEAAVDPQGGPEPARVPLRSQVLAGLTASLVRGRTKVLPTDKEFEALKEALGLKAAGPGMLAALRLDDGRKAGMLLFAGPEQGAWSASDLETFEAWANSMSHRIGSASEGPAGSGPPEQVETLKAELRLALEELAEVSSQTDHRDPIPVGSLTALIEGMRGPLASIQGYGEMLAGGGIGELAPDQRKFVNGIRDSTGQVLGQLTRLLDLIRGGEAQVGRQADVIAAVEAAVAQVAGPLKERDQSLHLELAESLPALKGASDELRQIMVTLIENAIQASPVGAVIPVSALATDSADGAWVSLSVSDSGGGIPPEELGRVFHKPEPGRGVESGLARVKQLAEGMGGRVWVGSEVGGGSTVTVLIPARQD